MQAEGHSRADKLFACHFTEKSDRTRSWPKKEQVMPRLAVWIYARYCFSALHPKCIYGAPGVSTWTRLTKKWEVQAFYSSGVFSQTNLVSPGLESDRKVFRQQPFTRHTVLVFMLLFYQIKKKSISGVRQPRIRILIRKTGAGIAFGRRL